jgi:hypothetical protein
LVGDDEVDHPPEELLGEGDLRPGTVEDHRSTDELHDVVNGQPAGRFDVDGTSQMAL